MIFAMLLAALVYMLGILAAHYGRRCLYVPRHAALEVAEAAPWTGEDAYPARPLRIAPYVLEVA